MKLWWLRYAWRRWQWKRSGSPMIHYEGFNCGCCGRWHDTSFDVPTYESVGANWDTWGLCPKGAGCCADS